MNLVHAQLFPRSTPSLQSAVAHLRRTQRRKYVVAVAAIAAATGVGYIWATMPDPRNLSLVFFGAVLLVGVWTGLRPAIVAALLAFFSYNFLLIQPRFSLHFAPADILAFGSFLAGALVVGGLSGRLSDRARDATSRLRALTSLFEVSRDLSGALNSYEAAKRIVNELERHERRAAIWLGRSGDLRLAAATPSLTAAEKETASAQLSALLLRSERESDNGERVLLQLEAGERTLGAIAIWPAFGPHEGWPDRRWVDALLELGAVAIDRARLISEVAEASVVAEKEGLRTALLSSLSHDLRTPIATILASASALHDQGERFAPETRRDMLETIQDESERLNRYVANLLEMTRLESGALQVRSVLIDPGEAMASAVESVGARLKRRRVLRVFNTDGQRILVDPVLIEQALVNVLENAISYCAPDGSIFVKTEREGERIVLSVEDEGPGIPQPDLQHVFDKFFQGRSDRRQGAGVGLGLSVSRGLIEAFGGEVRAISPAAGDKGTRIEFLLPAHPALDPVE